MVYSLILNSTENCDQGCRNCAYRSSKNGKDMPLDTAKIAIDKFLRFASGNAMLTIQGGEPLSRLNLLYKIMDYAYSKGLGSFIVTNSKPAVSRDMAEKIAKNLVDRGCIGGWLSFGPDYNDKTYSDNPIPLERMVSLFDSLVPKLLDPNSLTLDMHYTRKTKFDAVQLARKAYHEVDPNLRKNFRIMSNPFSAVGKGRNARDEIVVPIPSSNRYLCKEASIRQDSCFSVAANGDVSCGGGWSCYYMNYGNILNDDFLKILDRWKNDKLGQFIRANGFDIILRVIEEHFPEKFRQNGYSDGCEIHEDLLLDSQLMEGIQKIIFESTFKKEDYIDDSITLFDFDIPKKEPTLVIAVGKQIMEQLDEERPIGIDSPITLGVHSYLAVRDNGSIQDYRKEDGSRPNGIEQNSPKDYLELLTIVPYGLVVLENESDFSKMESCAHNLGIENIIVVRGIDSLEGTLNSVI